MSFIPVTPGGTPLVGLAAIDEQTAKDRLMKDARHMPYRDWQDFQKRGYTIIEDEAVAVLDTPKWYGMGGT